MTDKPTLDTNVLIYAFGKHGDKRKFETSSTSPNGAEYNNDGCSPSKKEKNQGFTLC